MKILCVHGWLSTPEHMKSQLETWEKELPEVSFVYYRGKNTVPAKLNYASEQVVRFHLDRKLFTAYTHLDLDSRFFYYGASWSDEMIMPMVAPLIKFVNQEKTAAGLFGFSQGAMLVHLFCSLMAAGRLDKYLDIDTVRPRFAILCCFPYGLNALGRINLPSLHLISTNDQVADNPLLVTMQYEEPTVLFDSIGHGIPRMGSTMKSELRRFLAKAGEQLLGAANSEKL